VLASPHVATLRSTYALVYHMYKAVRPPYRRHDEAKEEDSMTEYAPRATNKDVASSAHMGEDAWTS
jgi:hypothetical protein